MSEPAMSAHAAVAEIQRLQSLRRPLERRTSGISWMIWGLAVTGIFVTYNYFGVVAAFITADALFLMPFLWIPWVIMGTLATRAIYASAGVLVGKIGNSREGLVIGLLFVVVMFAGFGIAGAMGFPLVEPAVFLGLVGLVSLILGATGYSCVDPTERRLHLIGGALMVALAVGPAPWLPSREAAYALYSNLAPLATAIVYFGSGLFLVQRG